MKLSKIKVWSTLLLFGAMTFVEVSLSAQDSAASGEGLSAEERAALEASDETGQKKSVKLAPIRKTFTKSKRRKICGRLEAKYISYYGKIYFVKNCRRQLLKSSDVFYLTRDRIKIVEVDRDAIIAIAEGEDYVFRDVHEKFRNCRELEGRYITFKFGDLFYVKRCKKRMFQDWGSFETHRGHISAKNATVLSLTWGEFSNLKEGRPMPSIILKENRLKSNISRDVDVIPLDEACSGINGRFVSYYSKIYKIEKCTKRAMDEVAFSKQYGSRSGRIREMTSEQWISIPNGPPLLTLYKKQANK